jgi:hypothetical protein
MSKKVNELSAAQLRVHIDPENFDFEHTGLLDPLKNRVLGQERAIDAIKFGMGMKTKNYHIFIAGPQNTGLTYADRTYLEEQAKDEPTPSDWCYVHNFKEPDTPKSLKISAGRGRELKKDMHELISALEVTIPVVFESDDYNSRDNDLKKSFELERKKIIEGLSKLAKKENFVLKVSQVGMVIGGGPKKLYSMISSESA